MLSPENRSVLRNLEPTPEMLAQAYGRAPSPEHQGIMSRLIFEYMGKPDRLVTLPSLLNPKSWNQAKPMMHLMFLFYTPWREVRYDPQAETAVVSLSTGQWAFHTKGTDSNGVLWNLVFSMMARAEKTGFTSMMETLEQNGYISTRPADYPGVQASDLTEKYGLCEKAFAKFMARTSAIKESIEVLQREPLMMFDTSTVNSLTGLAAFGNGVVPTTDIYDTSEYGSTLAYPAGKLIPADIDFVLSSAAGLEFPTGDSFAELMDMRTDVEHGEGTWDDWLDAALKFSELVLQNKAPTYYSFLRHAFPAEEGLPPLERDAFLRLLGAAVFGSNLKILAAMIGEPNSGKDTVIKWLTYILGTDQVGVLSPVALTQNADDQRAFAPLKGARLAVVSGEVGEGRRSGLMAEKIKSITSGGGTLTVAEKYEKPTSIFFDGMLIMQGNSVPTIIGGDKALYKNRLVAVEFRHPFKLGARSYEKEYRREAPFFLQVLFIHYLNYMEMGAGMTGISPPKSWRSFGDDVEFMADPFTVIDRCITRPRGKSVSIPTPVFYRALSILATDTLGLHPLSSNRWSARLRKAGVDLTKDANTLWRSRTADGYVMHFTLDANESNGLFSNEDWTRALTQARIAVESTN